MQGGTWSRRAAVTLEQCSIECCSDPPNPILPRNGAGRGKATPQHRDPHFARPTPGSRHLASSAGTARALTELEEAQAWIEDGAHDMAHWTTMHLGISRWKAERWLSSGRALRTLPAIAGALERGVLGIDKVVELTRFAEFDDEDALVRWAQGVSSGAIRRIGDLRARESVEEETVAAERDRWLEYRYADGGRRFRLDAELPGAAGAVVARALDRLGESRHARRGVRAARGCSEGRRPRGPVLGGARRRLRPGSGDRRRSCRTGRPARPRRQRPHRRRPRHRRHHAAPAALQRTDAGPWSSIRTARCTGSAGSHANPLRG